MAAPASRQVVAATRAPSKLPHRLPEQARRPAPRSRRPAALPADALDALPAAAAAAASASLLTALWLRRSGDGGQQQCIDDAEEPPQPAAEQQAEPPGSPEAIWAAAWQGFAPPAGAQQPTAAAGAAAGPEAELSASGQQDEREEGAAQQAARLRRSPVLLLEGIRAADRSRLLALCLAALEAQVAALPPGAGLPGAGAAQWHQLASALLALSSVAAAAAWLGYVPGRLLDAAAKQLAAADPTVLQAAGLQAAAVALQRQTAAAAGASIGDGEEEEEEEEQEEEDGSNAVAWYCLEEKLQVYSSVLRLLSCSTIEQQQERRQQEAAALGLPLASTASTDGDDAVAAAGGVGSGGALARQRALALLQQRQAEKGPPGAIRGWRATAAGTRSETQLLSLAPAVLQDMAVSAADAVAAAYLADAAAAGPSAMAQQAGAARSLQPEPAPAQQPAGSAGELQAAGLALQSLDSGSSASAGGGARPLEAGWWPTFVHRQLGSTRQLQRFANGVALQRWLHRQWHGVVDIYEDRLQLWAVAGGGRRLEARSAPMKRTPELGRLSGLRYAASLLLEAADLALPLLRTLWCQATAVVSWLLVRLVGQAVALVRRGVQQGTAQAAAAAAGSAGQQAGAAVQEQRQRGRRRGRERERSGLEQPGGGSPAEWAWQG